MCAACSMVHACGACVVRANVARLREGVGFVLMRSACANVHVNFIFFLSFLLSFFLFLCYYTHYYGRRCPYVSVSYLDNSAGA